MLVLDAGAFLAVEHGDRDVVALVKRERLAAAGAGDRRGSGAQRWRGGCGRQAPLARLLAGTDVVAELLRREPEDLVHGAAAQPVSTRSWGRGMTRRGWRASLMS
jgi:hypothetical protein